METSTLETDGDNLVSLRQSLVEKRKTFVRDEVTMKAAKALGTLAAHFLMVRPWCQIKDWDEYIYRHEDQRSKTYSGFSSCFLRVLEDLVVKTRPEDVDKDIVLPIMRHRTVYLKPCWFDKMTANLFVQVIRANAITSERIGTDYLFHKDSGKARHILMKNLRQSNFAWTAFTPDDVIATVETSKKYLASADKVCSEKDEELLRESSQMVSRLENSEPWKALGKAHEVGLAIENWPEESEENFSLTYPARPTMVGITNLLNAQSHIDSNILSQNPTDGLKTVGQIMREKLAAIAVHDDTSNSTRLCKNGLPNSCVREQKPVSGQGVTTKSCTLSSQETHVYSRRAQINAAVKSPARPKKRRFTCADETADLAETSPLRDTRIIGTTSAKLTYLLEKVVEHQAEEKILIFYDGDNAAYYIAQGLELLHIDHRIYARTLDNAKRSEHVRVFNEDVEVRVLLIDVCCGALGLNLNVASVVLIVNPINRPFLEAQAIKRVRPG